MSRTYIPTQENTVTIEKFAKLKKIFHISIDQALSAFKIIYLVWF
jgi:hypothetical protein